MTHILRSNVLEVHFTSDSFEMFFLRNHITNESVGLLPESNFSFQHTIDKVDASHLEPKLLEADEHLLRVQYLTDLFEIEVIHTLENEVSFILPERVAILLKINFI